MLWEYLIIHGIKISKKINYFVKPRASRYFGACCETLAELSELCKDMLKVNAHQIELQSKFAPPPHLMERSMIVISCIHKGDMHEQFADTLDGLWGVRRRKTLHLSYTHLIFNEPWNFAFHMHKHKAPPDYAIIVWKQRLCWKSFHSHFANS